MKAIKDFIINPQFFSITSLHICLYLSPQHHSPSCSSLSHPVIVSVAKLVALVIMRDKARLEKGMEGTRGWRGNQRVHLLRVLVVNKPEAIRCEVSWGLERRKQQTGMLSVVNETAHSSRDRAWWLTVYSLTGSFRGLVAVDDCHNVRDILSCHVMPTWCHMTLDEESTLSVCRRVSLFVVKTKLQADGNERD